MSEPQNAGLQLLARVIAEDHKRFSLAGQAARAAFASQTDPGNLAPSLEAFLNCYFGQLTLTQLFRLQRLFAFPSPQPARRPHRRSS